MALPRDGLFRFTRPRLLGIGRRRLGARVGGWVTPRVLGCLLCPVGAQAAVISEVYVEDQGDEVSFVEVSGLTPGVGVQLVVFDTQFFPLGALRGYQVPLAGEVIPASGTVLIGTEAWGTRLDITVRPHVEAAGLRVRPGFTLAVLDGGFPTGDAVPRPGDWLDAVYIDAGPVVPPAGATGLNAGLGEVAVRTAEAGWLTGRPVHQQVQQGGRTTYLSPGRVNGAAIPLPVPEPGALLPAVGALMAWGRRRTR